MYTTSQEPERDHRVTFGTLTPDGKLADVRRIRQSDMLKCPHCIILPEHYRDDGTCRCNDWSHTVMLEWGYKWRKGQWR